MNSSVVELVTFSLKPNADPEQFLVDNGAVEAFCRRQSGFVARRLCCDDQGNWADCVEWADMDAAKAAAKAIGTDPAPGPWLEAIDMEGLSMRHLKICAAL